MRDYRQLLADDRCWDAATQAVYESTGIPLDDCVLQNREELIALCEFIEANKVRRYVEIGAWTGRLVTVLHRLFDFDLVAVCDIGAAETLGLPFRLPFGCEFHKGSSHSDAYVAWRQELGPVDLVFIDGDHTFEGVQEDWRINAALPHRFLVFHDITGAEPTTAGVGQFWKSLGGSKVEFIKPHRELGLDGSTMGIGVWSADKPQP